MENEQKYIYVKPVEGRVVPRYGTGSFIGHSYSAGVGYVIHDGEITALPEIHYKRYGKEYNRAIRDGSLVQVSQDEYDASLYAQEAKSEAEAKAAKKAKSKSKPAKGAAKKKESDE